MVCVVLSVREQLHTSGIANHIPWFAWKYGMEVTIFNSSRLPALAIHDRLSIAMKCLESLLVRRTHKDRTRLLFNGWHIIAENAGYPVLTRLPETSESSKETTERIL